MCDHDGKSTGAMVLREGGRAELVVYCEGCESVLTSVGNLLYEPRPAWPADGRDAWRSQPTKP